MLHGVRLSLLVGPTVPLPAPAPLLEALRAVEVTHDDEQRAGFQLVLAAGRGVAGALRDFALLEGPLLQPFARVVIGVSFGPTARVLFDGFITDRQVSPGEGGATLTITGEDLSLMMDQEERAEAHPNQSDPAIAAALILRYARYGIVPVVIPPPSSAAPTLAERVPARRATDLATLRERAARYGFVFSIAPGPAPLVSQGYWGPPVRLGPPQPALSVDMGSASTVERLSFRQNSLAGARVRAFLPDRSTGRARPLEAGPDGREPLSAEPGALAPPEGRRAAMLTLPGEDTAAAQARAQGAADAAAPGVSAEGELDTLRYGGVLMPRGLVGVRGAGLGNDGFYYIKRVSHSLARGSYRQRFTLTREGLGPLRPTVTP